MKTFKWTIVLVLTLLSCACSSTGKVHWVSEELAAPNEDILWDAAMLSLSKAGYPVGSGANPGERKIVTGWLKSNEPFKGRGFRRQATLTYQLVDGSNYVVNVRSKRERNDSFRPLSPGHAKWVPDDDDLQHARLVLQYLKSTLGGVLTIDAERPDDPFATRD